MHLYLSRQPLPLGELAKDFMERTGMNEGEEMAFGGSAELLVVRNKAGKPFFPTLPTIHFSVSHTGDIWSCCFHKAPIGIDIEDPSIRRPSFSPAKIAKRYFTQEEQDFIENTGLNGFLRVWTCKEAYLKYLGTGIAGGLGHFSVATKAGFKETVNEARLYEMAELKGFDQTGLIGAACIGDETGKGAWTWETI